MKLIVLASKPDDPCLPIGIVIPVPLQKVKEALLDLFHTAPELNGHRMVNVKDQPGDFFYYEVASSDGSQFLAKGILTDDHSGGTDIRIDNRQPPRDSCSASQKSAVVQLTRMFSEFLVSRGYAPESDLAQLQELELYVEAGSLSRSPFGASSMSGGGSMADLLTQLVGITKDMDSGLIGEEQALPSRPPGTPLAVRYEHQ